MKRCPSCAQEIEDAETGWPARQLTDAATLTAGSAPGLRHGEPSGVDEAATGRPAPTSVDTPPKPWIVVTTATTGLLAGIAAVMLLGRSPAPGNEGEGPPALVVANATDQLRRDLAEARPELGRTEAGQVDGARRPAIGALGPEEPARPVSSGQPVESFAAAAAGADRRSPPTQEQPHSVSATKWTSERSGGDNAVTFELRAENYVLVWRKRVRPVLGVRCLSGNTDVYVLTDWAASIEPEADRHAVRIGFDSEARSDERWLDSTDYQALFAPDGVALARRIASARTMRFGFTPYNAAPVVAEFDVRGFDALVGSVGRSCKWKP